MSFYPIMLQGSVAYVSVSRLGLHIHTSGAPFRALMDIVKPKKEIISETKSDGLPTWKVLVFNIYPWHFSQFLETFPEFEADCKRILSSLENSQDDAQVWPDYKEDPRWFEYQKEGVAWLVKNKGGMICDEMGLGKTIQAIGFLENSPYKFSLIVSPASMIYTWQSELKDWSSWTGVVLDGKRKITKAINKDVGDWEEKTAFILSWSAIALHYQALVDWGIDFEAMICDESHYAKGMDAKRTQSVLLMSKLVKSTVLLSGTPMRNCAIDLFPQLHMVSPSSFPGFQEYASRYSPPRERTFGRSTVLVYDQSKNLGELRTLVKDHMKFRKKKDVLKDLPSKRYRKIVIDTPRSLSKDWSDIIKMATSGQQIDSARMIQHRQEVGLSKAQVIAEWLEDNSSLDNPVVVFIVHQNTRVLLEEAFKASKISYACIVGATPNASRRKIIKDFQGGKIQVLVCSEAGKEGITLTRSSSLVQLERFWVPADEEQAEARIWRIGQENPVIISQAHMPGTIDDFIVGKLIRKREVIQEVFSDHSMDEDTFALLDRMFENMF